MPESQVTNDHTALFHDGLAGRTDGATRFQQRGDDAAAGAVSVGAFLVFYARVDVGAEPDLCFSSLDLCRR
jgi:hypothetical protein